MTSTLDLRLADVGVRLRCNFPALLEYAAAHFGPVRTELGPGEAPVIDAELRWHEGHPPAEIAAAYPEVAGCERVDRDLWLGPDTLVWLRVDDMRDLHLRLRRRGECLEVRGEYYHRLSTDRRADRVRRLVYRTRLGALRRKRFTRLLYYLVYYPVFWWQEHYRDAHPVHAAAVATSAGAVVLAGPSGVGKSTLTTALGAEEGARILSDTFVLQRGTELWAVSEPLLLDRWSVHWLGEAAGGLGGLEHSYALGRDGFVVPRSRFTERAEASVVILPRRAAKPFLRRIDGDTAASRIHAYDDIVNDLRRYRAAAAVLELLEPIGLDRARVRSLAELTRAVPCYELGVNQSVNRGEAVSTLYSTLHDRQQSPSASRA
jgi:hypothetical protein